MREGPTLVTGATGYIGGRLVPELLDAGHRVRCLARTPDKLRDHPWRDRVEAVRGDVVVGEGLDDAFRGVETAYYLVHSVSGGSGFQDTDAEAARNFARAAEEAGASRLVYLGGLSPEGAACRRTWPHARRSAGSCWSRACPPRCCARR